MPGPPRAVGAEMTDKDSLTPREAPQSKLLPCPFCGGRAELHETDWCTPPEYSVHCLNHKCRAWGGLGTNKAKTIAAWNRREKPVICYADIGDPPTGLQRDHARASGLNDHGDCVAIWINEGDLCTLMLEGRMKHFPIAREPDTRGEAT